MLPLPKRSRPDSPGAIPRKRLDLGPRAAGTEVSRALRVRESALFRPVRALGVVSDGLPFALTSTGSSDRVVVSIGRGFQVFDCKHLRLAYIGPRLSEKIRALASLGEVCITALKLDVVVWWKLVELGRLRGHTAPATVLRTIGSSLLLSASSAETLVWQLSDVGLEQPDSSSTHQGKRIFAPLAKLTHAADFGECTAACHPPTYLHKMVLGGSLGGLALWNLRKQELVHTFRSHQVAGQGACAVSCLREAPNVLDLLAVGFASGRICLLNARVDRVLFEFHQAQGRVTALTFRAAVGASAPAHLVSGAPNGVLVVWDLEKRRAHHVMEGAHNGPVTSAQFLPGQPVLLTCGRDNSLREFIFDTPDGIPRPLRSRCGCPGVARHLAFYGEEDRNMIVGGAFEGGGFVARISLILDQQNKSYSQKNITKLPASMTPFAREQLAQLPPVVDMAFCEARHYDWPAIVTAHERCDAALLWSASHEALAPQAMKPPETEGAAPVTSVAVSACGNFCVLGLETGAMHRFNLQSALYRGPFPKHPEKFEEVTGESAKRTKAQVPAKPSRAHRGRVCGLAITVSAQVISASSHPSDCNLKLWKLATHEAIATVPLNANRSGTPSCSMLRAHGSLVAISLDDGGLLVVDLPGAAVVRSFSCGVPATDIAFSSDGRWLAATLCDGGLRIFDLPAARCIDSFVFAKPALGVCFSPSTAFMMTSHQKGNAIQVWANKFLFDPALSAPLLRPEPANPIHVDEPGGPDEEESDEEEQRDEADKQLQSTQAPVSPPVPLEKDLLTLSDVPPAKWLATLHLDLVKERNKAAEPPKLLPNAPFFLPTAHEGVTPRFVAPSDGAGDADGTGFFTQEPASRVLMSEKALAVVSPFQEMLHKGEYDKALMFLKEQTPSGVHLAIEALGPLAGGGLAETRRGLEFFRHHLERAHYADEVQAYLSLFLQAHGEDIAASAKLRGLCAELVQVQEKLWSGINSQCHKARCFLGMLTHTQSQW